MIETINSGQAETSFMQDGDVVRLQMHDSGGQSVFGSIEQRLQIRS